MKSKLTLLFSLAVLFMNAQVIATLHHNGNTTVYYNQYGLSDAHTAAVNGDTIYLSGGHFNPVTINKRLCIFGAGHYPDSTAATQVTYIDGGFTIQDGGDSSRIEGLNTGTISFGYDQAVSYVTIRRNYVNGSIDVGGSRTTPSMYATITGNVITGNVNGSNMLQCDISNNIINGTVNSMLNCSFRNNIVFVSAYAGWPYYTYYAVNDCDNSLFENNVFTANSTFLLSDNTLARYNVFVSVPGNVAGTTNFTNSYTSVTMSSYFVTNAANSFSYTDNYHLQSPTTYPGSDASQTGIYGGPRPYKAGAVPQNPHIRSVNVPATTDVNGNLNINIQAGAQQN